MSRVDAVVVGAGITGLTCAYRLQKLGVETLVLESSDRIGGVIRTEKLHGYLVEWGPSSLLPTPHTFGFLEELGLDKDLIQADPKSPRYIAVGGRLRAVPLGPLSAGGILRGIAEPLIRSKSSGDESVAAFFRRRFGRQVHDRLVAPFVTGIFAGDTEKLSVGAVFPRILEIEQRHGSIILGMLRGKPKTAVSGKARRSTISSFPEGLETLPLRIAEGLKIQTRCSGIRIGKEPEEVDKARDAALAAFAAALRHVLLPHRLDVDPAELPQQLLRTLVEQLRQHDANLHDQVAPLSVPRGRRSVPSQAEPLPALGPGGHAQPRRAIQRTHLDPCAERRLVGRDVEMRDHDLFERNQIVILNVTAVAPEMRCNSVGTREFANHGGGNRVRLVGSTSLTNCRDMINVDVQSAHYDLIRLGAAAARFLPSPPNCICRPDCSSRLSRLPSAL